MHATHTVSAGRLARARLIQVQWLCTIRTANEHGADTRSRVLLSLFGEKGMRLDVPVTSEGDELSLGSEARITFWSAMLGP